MKREHGAEDGSSKAVDLLARREHRIYCGRNVTTYEPTLEAYPLLARHREDGRWMLAALMPLVREMNSE